jgi:3-oxoacyl-(acyl-carrier-protein) synthase
VRAGGKELAGLRRNPGTLSGSQFPAGRLKHVDAQTVVGVAAVLRAIEESGLDPNGFGEWSVVAAPRFLGRATFDTVFPQFLAEGAWGVSPHLVANHSLHAVSGMISQTLKAHGPNLGAGGAPCQEIEAFLAAGTLIDAGLSAGVWVVLTGCEHEGGAEGEFQALALALTSPRANWNGARLSIQPGHLVVTPRPESLSVGVSVSGSSLWRIDAGSSQTVTASNVHLRTLGSPVGGRSERADGGDGERK